MNYQAEDNLMMPKKIFDTILFINFIVMKNWLVKSMTFVIKDNIFWIQREFNNLFWGCNNKDLKVFKKVSLVWYQASITFIYIYFISKFTIKYIHMFERYF